MPIPYTFPAPPQDWDALGEELQALARVCTFDVRTFEPVWLGLTVNPAIGDGTITVDQWVGAANALDSGTAFRNGVCRIPDADSDIFIESDGGAASWQSTVPHTWAVNDTLSLSLFYRVNLADE